MIGRLLAKDRSLRIFNMVMAVLLVGLHCTHRAHLNDQAGCHRMPGPAAWNSTDAKNRYRFNE